MDLVEICYDDIFDKVLDTWIELGKSIPANSGFNWVDSVSNLFKSVNGNKDLFLRYGGDVMLYCGFDLVARTVRLRVNSTIATKIYQAYIAAGEMPGQVPRLCVIAHSLGTTVAQDALDQLANASWHDEHETLSAQLPNLVTDNHLDQVGRSDYKAVLNGVKQFPDQPVPVGLNSLFLIANTIPLLKQVDGEYALKKATGGGYDCSAVFNVNNRYDPVSLICGGLPNPNPVPRPGWYDITIQHIHNKNIHGFGHYLSNPAVHGPIFRRLIDPDFTSTCYSTSQTLSQSDEWKGFGGALAKLDMQARQNLEEKIQALFAGNTTVDSLRTAIETLAKLT